MASSCPRAYVADARGMVRMGGGMRTLTGAATLTRTTCLGAWAVGRGALVLRATCPRPVLARRLIARLASRGRRRRIGHRPGGAGPASAAVTRVCRVLPRLDAMPHRSSVTSKAALARDGCVTTYRSSKKATRLSSGCGAVAACRRASLARTIRPDGRPGSGQRSPTNSRWRGSRRRGEANEREQLRRHLAEFAEEGRPRHAVVGAAGRQATPTRLLGVSRGRHARGWQGRPFPLWLVTRIGMAA